MPLSTVPCVGRTTVNVTAGNTTTSRNLIFECIKVKKVFDEFVLRECVEGIRFEVCRKPSGGKIEPTLILKNCKLHDVEIKDVSTSTERRLRFSGKCCCEVFGKDNRDNIIRLKVISIPDNSRLSIGPDGELCFSFNVRREYPSATRANFESLLHFLEEGRFELQCFSEAVIDEENNEVEDDILITSLGIFLAVKFDAEVQLCVPVLGYCAIEEAIVAEERFCDQFAFTDIPSFNPPQLDAAIEPY